MDVIEKCNRLKFSKEDKTQIKSLKYKTKEKDIYKRMKSGIMELRGQAVIKFYSLFYDRNEYFQAIVTQSIQIEQILKELISIKKKKSLKLISYIKFEEIINAAFVEGLITKKVTEAIHKFRLLRNNYVHKLLFAGTRGGIINSIDCERATEYIIKLQVDLDKLRGENNIKSEKTRTSEMIASMFS